MTRGLSRLKRGQKTTKNWSPDSSRPETIPLQRPNLLTRYDLMSQLRNLCPRTCVNVHSPHVTLYLDANSTNTFVGPTCLPLTYKVTPRVVNESLVLMCKHLGELLVSPLRSSHSIKWGPTSVLSDISRPAPGLDPLSLWLLVSLCLQVLPLPLSLEAPYPIIDPLFHHGVCTSFLPPNTTPLHSGLVFPLSSGNPK